MTREQAAKIAEAIFDQAEREGHLSKDLVTDAIFNSWHRATADKYRVQAAAYWQVRELMDKVGFVDPDKFLRQPELPRGWDWQVMPVENEFTNRAGYYQANGEWYRPDGTRASCTYRTTASGTVYTLPICDKTDAPIDMQLDD